MEENKTNKKNIHSLIIVLLSIILVGLGLMSVFEIKFLVMFFIFFFITLILAMKFGNDDLKSTI